MTEEMPVEYGPITAYVLITVPAKHSGYIAEKLITEMSTHVKEAAIIYGDADVMAKVQANSMAEMHNVVMNRIQALDGVELTRTFIAVPPIRYSRE